MPTTLAPRIVRLVSMALSTALVVAFMTTSTAARADGAKKGGETATALAHDSAPAPKAKPTPKPRAKAKAKARAKARPKAKVASNSSASKSKASKHGAKHPWSKSSGHAPRRR